MQEKQRFLMQSVLHSMGSRVVPIEIPKILEVSMRKILPQAMWIFIFLIRETGITYVENLPMKEKSSVEQVLF